MKLIHLQFEGLHLSCDSLRCVRHVIEKINFVTLVFSCAYQPICIHGLMTSLLSNQIKIK